MAIDYARMQKSGPKLKAKLTRAQHAHDPESVYYAVKKACKVAVMEWNEIGAWPDNWSLWQRAFDDATSAFQRWAIAHPGLLINKPPTSTVRLEEL
jgi:hypothetical protein